MSSKKKSPDNHVQKAVEAFWFKRGAQGEKTDDPATVARANGHLLELTQLVGKMFVSAGLAESDLKIGRPYLPGYYRARKQWDLVARYKGHLVAAVELKSQVGSVAKNLNNRLEEALGSATDTLTAQQKFQPFGEIPPWLGYVLVLEETEETEKVPDSHALFPMDPVFLNHSYNKRYQEMITRFLSNRIYEAAWFVTTQRTGVTSVTFQEPLNIATRQGFEVLLKARVDFIKQAFP